MVQGGEILNVVSQHHDEGTTTSQGDSGDKRKFIEQAETDGQKRLKRDADVAAELDKLDRLLGEFQVCKLLFWRANKNSNF